LSAKLKTETARSIQYCDWRYGSVSPRTEYHHPPQIQAVSTPGIFPPSIWGI